MKIHIVQKGDTLWKIAKKYGVNFDALKQANTQLSNPDMIMPGMKIKVPTGNVQVKKEEQISPVQKETQINVAPIKEQKVEHPYADITPQPFPVMEVEELPEVKEEVAGVQTGPYIPQMPQMPQMPQFEIDINNYNLMNMQMPYVPPAPTNVLPGMMAPEEDEVLPAKEEIEMPQMPQMKPMPQMAPMHPCPPPCPPQMIPGCMPISPVMPGSGFNFVPGMQGGFPGNPMQGLRVEASPNLVSKESIEMPPQMPTAPQQVSPVEMAPMPEVQPMPQMAPMHPCPPQMMQGCVPISPVMPGSGFNGFPIGPMMPQMPPMMQPFQGMPQQGFDMSNQVAGAQVQQLPFMGPMNPRPMQHAPHYKKKDCGCGGPKPQFGGQYQMPMQPQIPVQGVQGPFGGYPGQGFQQPPFGVNPYQQVPFNPMFDMPDFDDDLDD